jgi:hypothetical protein
MAIVRTLLDEFERVLSRHDGIEGDAPVSAASQLYDELARLSHEIREMTAAFPESLRSAKVPVPDDSGTRSVDIRRTG